MLVCLLAIVLAAAFPIAFLSRSATVAKLARTVGFMAAAVAVGALAHWSPNGLAGLLGGTMAAGLAIGMSAWH